MRDLRAIDLCSGCGGWAVAARGLPIRIEVAVDFWQPACQTYRLNHPATDVHCADLRDPSVQARIEGLAAGVDLVLGGIPCEWLSSYRRLTKVKAAELLDPRLPGGLRQIEWQEAAALQGFPEDYLFYGSPGDVSLQIGRAVQIDTARQILRAICRAAELGPQSPAALAGVGQ